MFFFELITECLFAVIPKLRGLLPPLTPEPQKRGKLVSGNPAAVPLPPRGRLNGKRELCRLFSEYRLSLIRKNQIGIFYLNYSALLMAFLQTFSIKYS